MSSSSPVAGGEHVLGRRLKLLRELRLDDKCPGTPLLTRLSSPSQSARQTCAARTRARRVAPRKGSTLWPEARACCAAAPRLTRSSCSPSQVHALASATLEFDRGARRLGRPVDVRGPARACSSSMCSRVPPDHQQVASCVSVHQRIRHVHIGGRAKPVRRRLLREAVETLKQGSAHPRRHARPPSDVPRSMPC